MYICIGRERCRHIYIYIYVYVYIYIYIYIEREREGFLRRHAEAGADDLRFSKKNTNNYRQRYKQYK